MGCLGRNGLRLWTAYHARRALIHVCRPTCLTISLNLTVYSVKQVFYLLIPALGVGFLFQAPLLALQAAMPVKDMATSTATFGLLRTLGGTVGISIGEAIFSSVRSFSLYHELFY
jgi:hypothetical protein